MSSVERSSSYWGKSSLNWPAHFAIPWSSPVRETNDDVNGVEPSEHHVRGPDPNSGDKDDSHWSSAFLRFHLAKLEEGNEDPSEIHPFGEHSKPTLCPEGDEDPREIHHPLDEDEKPTTAPSLGHKVHPCGNDEEHGENYKNGVGPGGNDEQDNNQNKKLGPGEDDDAWLG